MMSAVDKLRAVNFSMGRRGHTALDFINNILNSVDRILIYYELEGCRLEYENKKKV